MDPIRTIGCRIADLAREIARAEGIRPQAAILRAGVRLAAEAGWRLVIRIDERPAGGRVTSVPEARRAVVYLGLEASPYTAAHEVGHAVLEALGHPSQLPGARGDACERAAWQVAAVVVARLGCHPDPEDRWLRDRLGELAGRRAWWRVTLAVCDGRVARIYQARVAGWIVPPRGRGWGWDPVYVPGPDPRRWTMAEWRDMAGGPPAGLDARARAVAALIAGRVAARVRLPLPAWRGAWQH